MDSGRESDVAYVMSRVGVGACGVTVSRGGEFCCGDAVCHAIGCRRGVSPRAVKEQSILGPGPQRCSKIKDYNDLFLKMDKDGDGKISKSDFLGAVNRLDIGMEENHINTLVWAMDSHSYTNDPKCILSECT